ncbi:MAG: LysE family transporter [Candidatus Aminicenantes bacterium]|nr:MAG: LysE family transporter [Candidatus Aminicenantes bacterium]
MLSIVLFYLIIYLTGFALCVMPGPVAIEIFHHALKKQNKHALSTGLGAGIGDGVWAMVAFFGITPFLKNGQGNHLEGVFLFIAAAITFIIGILATKDTHLFERVEKKEEAIAEKVTRKRKRWSFLKGITLMLVNPLGIGSWMIVLSFLKKVKVYIPLMLTYEILFFAAVVLGAFSYSVVIVGITKRIKPMFDHEKTAKIVKILGYLLIVFSIYFLFHSIRAFFHR